MSKGGNNGKQVHRQDDVTGSVGQQVLVHLCEHGGWDTHEADQEVSECQGRKVPVTGILPQHSSHTEGDDYQQVTDDYEG
jgi:hypothetical protein